MIATIKLPTFPLCLLEPEATSVLEALEGRALDDHGDGPVLLVQETALVGWSESWYRYLRDSALFDEIVNRSERIAILCETIRRSRCSWVYLGRGNCFGLWWELSLACHWRIWDGGDARVGFPEVLGSFVPLIQRQKVRSDSWAAREPWNRRTTLSMRDAVGAGFVDAVISSDAWDQFRDGTRSWPLTAVPDRMDSSRTSKGMERPDCFSYARSIVQPSYASWIRRRVAGSTQDAEWGKQHAEVRKTIAIDVGHVIPPTAAMHRMIKNNCHLLLVASNGKDLKSALELIHGRLEKVVKGPSFVDVWKRSVSWVACQPQQSPWPMIRWQLDESLHIVGGPRSLSFTALLDPFDPDGEVVLECLMPSAEVRAELPSLLDIAHRMSEAVVFSPIHPRSTAQALRMHFFSRLIENATAESGDLEQAIDALAKSGWGFAGSISSWQRFLAVPHEADSLVGNAPMTWRQARQMAKTGAALRKWSPTRFGRLMAGELAEIVRGMSTQNGFDLAAADFIATAALGFPKALTTPVSFFEHEGGARIYQRSHQLLGGGHVP